MTAKEVTRADVRRIWGAVLRHQLTAEHAASQAHEFRALANAESPVVNDGLHYLAGLTSPINDSAVGAIRQRWEAELEYWDSHPVEARNRMYSTMLLNFSQRHDADATRRFGRRLVRAGELTQSALEDVMQQVRNRALPT